ncbi:MAG: prepilin peptidase [Sphaerotilus sp.]|nr:prepilin peptidase [Sphaerotilus sp.]
MPTLTDRLEAACRDALGLQPRANQWQAARAMVDGRLAELATGEGKTLALALAAAQLALRGRSVHLLTANDYLAARDAEQLRGWYAQLGLRVAAIGADQDSAQRAAAYRADVVYVSARELVFDSLRDEVAGRSAWSGSRRDAHLSEHARALTQTPADDDRATVPAFDVALVDEADSILLDEALLPLVLARPGAPGERLAQLGLALDLAARLQPGRDFELQPVARDSLLTPEGAQRLEGLCKGLPRLWQHRLHREELVRLALVALHLLQPQRDYLVRQAQVQLIDPVTGRIAHGRMWSNGLQALVCLKEACPPPPPTETVARTTYSHFLRRYRLLGGTSATLHDPRQELRRLYGLAVTRVPPHAPSRRERGPNRWFADETARDQAVVARALALAAAGRPVLIGTDGVPQSLRLVAAFESACAAGAVAPRLQCLDARQDAQEAARIAEAGQPGCITVATRMAGRGVDIRLHPAAARAGGLHVLNCQDNPARRLDEQLFGRSGRQGDPGSVEHWRIGPARTLCAIRVPGAWRDLAWRLRQRASEARAADERHRLLLGDTLLHQHLDRLDPLAPHCPTAP